VGLETHQLEDRVGLRVFAQLLREDRRCGDYIVVVFEYFIVLARVQLVDDSQVGGSLL